MKGHLPVGSKSKIMPPSEAVTVIVPLFQKAAHVERALDSVLRQTYQQFEVVVVDDGSTDGGGERVARRGDPRIRVIRQDNRGAAAARNRGVEAARAPLVAFLDADDEWDSDFLDTALALRERCLSAASFGTAYRLRFPEGETRIPKYQGRLPEPAGGGLIDFFGGAPGNSPLHSSCVVVEKAALLSVGGFAEGVDLGEDHDTWLRLALAYPIAWTWCPAATVYLDAQNRSDNVMYHGNFPFLESVKRHREATGLSTPMPEDVRSYLIRRHLSLLSANWLAGDRKAIEEIVAGLWPLRGARTACVVWGTLALLPSSVVKVLWKGWRWIAGRRPIAPTLRPIRRPATVPEDRDPASA